MISVLIPIFNYNTLPLVKEIHKQLYNSNCSFEIICIDDASSDLSPEKNYLINELTFCSYARLDKNIGRSNIRNLLAKKAQYKNLLFLDCDVMPLYKTFISSYLKQHIIHDQIFCGGVSYVDQKPEKDQLLRWKYGKKREQISAKERNSSPHRYFFSSNFLISKSIFNFVAFNNELIDYGYEDLLFSEDLKKRNIVIKHIENPVIHFGLDSSAAFLSKTQHAIKNLNKLYKEQMISSKNNKLLDTYLKLKSWRLLSSFRIFFNISKSALENNLKSSRPLLFVFDLYRLGLLNKTMKN